MDYEVPPAIIEVVEELEGYSDTAYYDKNNVLTIGFGHTNATDTFKFNEDTVIDREQAIDILSKDLAEARKYVSQMLENRNLKVNDDRFDYMVLVYFNRPWALRDTIDVIAEGHIKSIRSSQEKAYEDKRGEAPPNWFMSRLDKEEAAMTNVMGGFIGPKDQAEGETINPLPDTITYMYDKDGNKSMVDASIVDELVESGRYFKEPPVKEEEPDVPNTRFPRKPMKLLDNFKGKIYTL